MFFFAQKHRLLVLVRTASSQMRRPQRVVDGALASTHNPCFGVKTRKNMYTHENPSFTISKWGLMGSKLHDRISMIICLEK